MMEPKLLLFLVVGFFFSSESLQRPKFILIKGYYGATEIKIGHSVKAVHKGRKSHLKHMPVPLRARGVQWMRQSPQNSERAEKLPQWICTIRCWFENTLSYRKTLCHFKGLCCDHCGNFGFLEYILFLILFKDSFFFLCFLIRLWPAFFIFF